MSSASSDNSEIDPMPLVSDDDYEPEVIIISSDDESEPDIFSDDDDLLDDFQPFALIHPVEDHAPLEDDAPQPLHDAIIYGHPEGEHMIAYLAVPLAVVPLIDLEDDDGVDIPVIPVEHLDDDIGDGEVHDIVILELPSPVVSVIDVSSTASSAASTTRTPVSSPATVLPTPTAVPPTPTTDPMHLPGFPHTMHPSPHFQPGPSSQQPFPHTFYDPYAAGPSHYARSPSPVRPPYTGTPTPPPGMHPTDPYYTPPISLPVMADMTISHEVQISIIFRRLGEMQTDMAAIRAAVAPPPPPASPQPPLPASPPPSPPPLPQSPPPPSPHQ